MFAFSQKSLCLRIVLVTAGLAVFLSGCPFAPVVMTKLENIRQNITLRPGAYIVKSDISVRDGKLTLLPGVKIYFEQGRRMSVEGTGRLYAVGTESNPILFTGVEKVRGYWGGLRLYNTNSSDNQLEHVSIEYGGGYWDGNLRVDGISTAAARVAINNCTFRQSAAYGLSSNGNVFIDSFEDNTLTANELGAATMNAGHIGFLDASSSFADNDDDLVAVPSGNVSDNAVWPGIDAFYSIGGNISVRAALTIEPGAVLAFESGRTMLVEMAGTLAVLGSADAPVFFTGAEPMPGYWGGLRFYNSGSTANTLSHAVFEYGGGYYDANVRVDGSSTAHARVAINHCTFRHSKEYGLSTSGSITISSFNNNTLTANTLGAARIAADHAAFLDASSTFIGNSVDMVHVSTGNVTSDAVWQGIDAPYYMSGHLDVGAALEINPGAVLVFGNGRAMSVNASGSLAAVGTASAPIVFTGAEAMQGYWGGLRYYDSNSPANILSHCVLEYGGGYYDGNLQVQGSTTRPVQVEVRDCVFENSAKWGIRLSGTFTVNLDIATANTFAGNVNGEIIGL